MTADLQAQRQARVRERFGDATPLQMTFQEFWEFANAHGIPADMGTRGPDGQSYASLAGIPVTLLAGRLEFSVNSAPIGIVDLYEKGNHEG